MWTEGFKAQGQGPRRTPKRRRVETVAQEIDVRWLVPYWQLEQGPLCFERIVGLLSRNGAPGTPELDRIWIVRDGALENVKRALVDWPPDHIVGDLSIPASMEKGLDESDG